MKNQNLKKNSFKKYIKNINLLDFSECFKDVLETLNFIIF